jgi:hypothetical protein
MVALIDLTGYRVSDGSCWQRFESSPCERCAGDCVNVAELVKPSNSVLFLEAASALS